MSLIPRLGRFSGRGNVNPLQGSCLGNAMSRGPWRATLHRVAKRHNWACTCEQSRVLLAKNKRDQEWSLGGQKPISISSSHCLYILVLKKYEVSISYWRSITSSHNPLIVSLGVLTLIYSFKNIDFKKSKVELYENKKMKTNGGNLISFTVCDERKIGVLYLARLRVCQNKNPCPIKAIPNYTINIDQIIICIS